MLKNKRKGVAALLIGCMVLGSSMSVFAGTANGYVGKQRTHLNVNMPTQTGANELTVYAPNGWDIGTATSFHTYQGSTTNLTAHS